MVEFIVKTISFAFLLTDMLMCALKQQIIENEVEMGREKIAEKLLNQFFAIK